MFTYSKYFHKFRAVLQHYIRMKMAEAQTHLLNQTTERYGTTQTLLQFKTQF